MKKLLLTASVILTLSASSIFAQTTDGPQAGQYGVTLNVSPLLGQIFNGNPTVTIPYGLNGKYYFSSSSGIRVNLDFGYGSNTETNYKDDDNGNPSDDVSYTVTTKVSNSFSLGAGYEMRKVAGKFQISYGPEVYYSFSGGSSKVYDYKDPKPNNGQLLEISDGNTNSIGIGGFLGVEYFIKPNFSIGTEFNVYGSYSKQGRGLSKFEGQDDKKSAKDNSNINLGIMNVGSILVSIYF